MVKMPIHKKVNKDFFKKWTPEMAYVLGFFAADGSMNINNRGAHFWSIQINDKELLENIREVIRSNHKISVRVKRKLKEYKSYRLQIGSKEMYNDLYNLGMRGNKTKNLVSPNVPKMFLNDFVRGYFDGDGHVWTGIINKERKSPHRIIQTIFTSCSRRFLVTLLDLLQVMISIKGRISKGKGNYYRLVYSIEGSLKLYDFMYNSGSNLFLNRKKIIFEEFIKMRV